MDELAAVASTIAVLLPKMNKLKVISVTDSTSSDQLRKWNEEHQITGYIGGEKLTQQVKEAGLMEVDLYNVTASDAEAGHYPIVVTEDRVTAISMPHPIAVTATNQFQAGWKEGALGKILPGYYVQSDAENPDSKSILTQPDSAPLRQATVDKEGFLMKV